MKLNKIETALVHALFTHLHHNIDQAIDFEAIEQLNNKINEVWPGALKVGPGDDAGVFQMPGVEGLFVAKMESHCSPCVPRPYESAATGAGGAMRDIVAMGGRPIFLLNFIGTRAMHEKVLIGPCGFSGECTCGKCIETTSKDRLNLIMNGVKEMCKTMDVFIVGGGLSTSFSDIVPAVVVAIIGKLVNKKPLTKPAKAVGDKIILIGKTSNDGNDSLFRAGLVDEMKPAVALWGEEKQTMEATLAAFETGKIKTCSDLGAAGIGAAVCESARYGGFGAKVDLTNVPLNVENITPEEILICETQARMTVQVLPEDVDEVMRAIESKGGIATLIGEITDDDKEIFEYNGKVIATIPNNPSEEILEEKKTKMYDTTKPYKKQIVELIKQTWETPYVSVKDGVVEKKFSYPECHHTDGMGTKGIFHWEQRSFRNAVLDSLAMNLNDLAMMRATPYALIDHLFLPEDDNDAILELVKSLSEECKKRNIAITGGETAIHNNMEGLEISMNILGFVEKPKPNLLKEGDVLIGIESNGLHSNGFTRVRELFDYKPDFILPTNIYLDTIMRLERECDIHGMMHITGGAFTKLRELLPNVDAIITNEHSLEPKEIFWELYRKGISDEEMYKTFNCGIGFVLGVSKEDSYRCLNKIREDFKASVIGEVVPGNGKIKIQSKFSNKEIEY